MSADPRMTTRLLKLLPLALLLPLGACDWFTDFKNEPKIEPWEPVSQLDADTTHAPRGNPQYSVPVTGTFVAGYQISYNAFPAVIDSIGRVAQNPTPVSQASLLNGRKYYNINCAVCHGEAGQGNGPATRYGMPGINLMTDVTKGRSDGYIYGMMRNGRGLMPTYNRIEEMDRWDVVNYVRALQGRVPNTAGVGPLGYPGQNGVTVPGYTASAPTRPAPQWRDTRGPLGGMRPGTQIPGVAGTVTTPAKVQGQVDLPVPAGPNDSGPQARLNPATAPTAPAPNAARPQQGARP